MTEKSMGGELQNASHVDPFEIGKKGKGIDDLARIDPGTLTIDDVKEFATSHVIYYESMGRVRLRPRQKKDFQEAKKLNSCLNKGKYRRAAEFFLRKAKEEWRGMENATDFGEQRWRIFGMEDVRTVPWNVVLGGDSAIKQFLNQKDLGMTLRMAGTDSAMYLREASVLARIIKK